MCVCERESVCVREREIDRDRKREREREKKRGQRLDDVVLDSASHAALRDREKHKYQAIVVLYQSCGEDRAAVS